MGFTCNWKRQPEYDAEKFADASYECNCILNRFTRGDARLCSIAGLEGDSNSDAIFNEQQILFNGQQPEACEPFIFNRVEAPRQDRDYVRGFCKTIRLPYTLAVQCCLLILKKHFGDTLIISADGELSDWDKALLLCQESSLAIGFGGGYDNYSMQQLGEK